MARAIGIAWPRGVHPAGCALDLAGQRARLRSVGDEPRPHRAGGAGIAASEQGDEPVDLGGLVEQVLDAELVAQRSGDRQAAVGGEQGPDVGLQGLETDDGDGEDGVADLQLADASG